MGTSNTPKPVQAKYPEEVYAIAQKARAIACPVTKQGPCAKQVWDTMRVLGDPEKALLTSHVSAAECARIAKGQDPKAARKLTALGDSIAAQGGAPQWTRGRYLAATLVVWLRHKKAQAKTQAGDTQTA